MHDAQRAAGRGFLSNFVRNWAPSPAAPRPRASASPDGSRAVADGSPNRLADAFDEMEVLASAGSPAEAARIAAYVLERLVPSESVSVALYDIDADALRFVANRIEGLQVGRPALSLAGSSILAREARGTDVVTFDDVTGDARFDAASDTCVPARSMLVAPVHAGSRLRAVVQLVNRRGGRFVAADVPVVEYVVDQLARFLGR
jgi:hypothetical protein